MPSCEITPIGTVRNNRTDVQHADNWGAVRSTITIDERFGEACLQGLEGFSHVEADGGWWIARAVVERDPERGLPP
ncbi:hypothetical protein ACFVAF_36465 [Streptomyces sp. NPDC057596]|uniref:hypothetical protein n=1 Tax=Streptomyces sp. NPDC057596 TaxID=3346178 RepID=UPI0036D05092